MALSYSSGVFVYVCACACMFVRVRACACRSALVLNAPQHQSVHDGFTGAFGRSKLRRKERFHFSTAQPSFHRSLSVILKVRFLSIETTMGLDLTIHKEKYTAPPPPPHIYTIQR